MKEAIEITIDRGWRKVIFEGDCKNLIEALNDIPEKAEWKTRGWIRTVSVRRKTEILFSNL